MSFPQVTTIEYLSTRFLPTISVRDLSEITTEHEQTIRNKISRKVYPIPSFTIGRKRLFRLIDVAEFIECQRKADPSYPAKARKKRGRPTKVQQLADRVATENEHTHQMFQGARHAVAR